MPSSTTGGEKIDQAERDSAIVEMRRKGQSLESIGLAVGLTRQRVHQIIKTRLEQIPVEAVEHYRADMLERLERAREEAAAIAFAAPDVVTDDDGAETADYGTKLAALREVRASEAQISKLLGLDAPARSEVRQGVTFTYRFEGAEDV